MSEIICFKCNGCGAIIESSKDRYRISLAGEKYYIGPGNSDYGQNIKELDFCEKCARNIKSSLEKIAKNME